MSFSLSGADDGTSVADANGRFQAYVTLRTLSNGQPNPTPGAIVLLSVLVRTNARHGVTRAPWRRPTIDGWRRLTGCGVSTARPHHARSAPRALRARRPGSSFP